MRTLSFGSLSHGRGPLEDVEPAGEIDHCSPIKSARGLFIELAIASCVGAADAAEDVVYGLLFFSCERGHYAWAVYQIA